MIRHTTMQHATHSAAGDGLQRRLEEAARYALLRRLTPALRHHMVGALQPLGMLAAMLERRSQSPAPDMPSIQKKSADMSVLSREATVACVNLVSWIAPKQADSVTVAEGVAECLGVVETDLALRGFAATNETAQALMTVPRSLMRGVFAAALLALTDAAGKPSEVVLQAEPLPGGASLTLTLRPRNAESMGMGGPTYRPLEWSDVEALASAESASLEHSAGHARIRYGVTG